MANNVKHETSDSLFCADYFNIVSVSSTVKRNISYWNAEYSGFWPWICAILNAQNGLSAYSASVKQTYVVYQRKWKISELTILLNETDGNETEWCHQILWRRFHAVWFGDDAVSCLSASLFAAFPKLCFVQLTDLFKRPLFAEMQ